MREAYLSGPYRAKTKEGIKRNIIRARQVSIELWKMGYAVLCPHMNTAFFPDHERIDYIVGDLTFIDRMDRYTDIMVFLPGWEKSQGSSLERKVAISRFIPLYLWPEDRKEIEALVKDE